jgi:uncharacterized SAM-binding protein YcdF (DUF218 family)
MYALKKLIASFVMPLPICMALLVVGLALLWFTARQRAARIVLTAGVALLALFAFAPLGNLVVRSLEAGYRPLLGPGADPADPLQARARQARFIVVLGGWHADTSTLPPNSQLGTSTLARLVEAVRLKHQLPEARLVLSGGFGSNGVTHADVLAGAAELLGIPRGDLLLERHTFDTGDEARLIHEIVRDAPFILVTSAGHLPRAIRLFRKQGMDPLPSPSDFSAPETGFTFRALFPGARGIGAFEYATHEYLGMLFHRLRGQI